LIKQKEIKEPYKCLSLFHFTPDKQFLAFFPQPLIFCFFFIKEKEKKQILRSIAAGEPVIILYIYPIMKTTSRIILFLALALTAYGYWGAFTQSGNKVYDEMDGYYPFFMMIAGLVLLVVFLILVIIMRRRRRK
jgi:hypothetical protein